MENEIPVISIKDGLQPLLDYLQQKNGKKVTIQTDVLLSEGQIATILVSTNYGTCVDDDKENRIYKFSK